MLGVVPRVAWSRWRRWPAGRVARRACSANSATGWDRSSSWLLMDRFKHRALTVSGGVSPGVEGSSRHFPGRCAGGFETLAGARSSTTKEPDEGFRQAQPAVAQDSVRLTDVVSTDRSLRSLLDHLVVAACDVVRVVSRRSLALAPQPPRSPRPGLSQAHPSGGPESVGSRRWSRRVAAGPSGVSQLPPSYGVVRRTPPRVSSATDRARGASTGSTGGGPRVGSAHGCGLD